MNVVVPLDVVATIVSILSAVGAVIWIVIQLNARIVKIEAKQAGQEDSISKLGLTIEKLGTAMNDLGEKIHELHISLTAIDSRQPKA